MGNTEAERLLLFKLTSRSETLDIRGKHLITIVLPMRNFFTRAFRRLSMVSCLKFAVPSRFRSLTAMRIMYVYSSECSLHRLPLQCTT